MTIITIANNNIITLLLFHEAIISKIMPLKLYKIDIQIISWYFNDWVTEHSHNKLIDKSIIFNANFNTGYIHLFIYYKYSIING